MKKVIAILVIALFLGGITAPAFASNNTSLISISTIDDDPKKAKKSTKKSEKKTSDCDAKAEAKSSGCAEKASDCDAKAKKDCGDK